jgi:hypothetical protein
MSLASLLTNHTAMLDIDESQADSLKQISDALAAYKVVVAIDDKAIAAELPENATETEQTKALLYYLNHAHTQLENIIGSLQIRLDASESNQDESGGIDGQSF